MQKTHFTFLAGSLIALVFFGCHKNNDNPEAISFQNLAGTYKVTALVLSQGSIKVNYYDSIDVCQKDDLFKFNKDSSFQYVDAGMVCNPDGSFSATWSLTGNILTVAGGNGVATVQSLTSKTMVLVSADTTYSPAVLTTETYARQ
jgi:hypothetical protein